MTTAQTEARAIPLSECPIGLFLASSGELCLKTEYGDNEGRIDAYIVSSGEFFWGGAKTRQDQRCVLVTPYDHEAELSALKKQVEELTKALTEAQDHIAHADAYHATAMSNLTRAETAEAEAAALRTILSALLFYVDQNTCVHETTRRGGAIWTICDDCGEKWADDRGGFVPYSDPEPVAHARAALASTRETSDA